MTDFLVPTSIELKQVEQDLLPNLLANRPIFQYFPIRESDDYVVSWEQLDNYVGLQALRGLNGAPPRVKRTGAKRYMVEPGTYGEHSVIDEAELTRRRSLGSFDQAIDLSDLVGQEQMRLMGRELDRIETMLWTLLSTGTFSISSVSGAIAHSDSYTMQTFSASVAWSTPATSTPLADFRSVQLLSRGHSVDFGAEAVAIANRGTANKMFSNSNSADLYGRRTSGFGTFGPSTGPGPGGTYNSLGDFNSLLMRDDLPSLTIYDKGYVNDAGTFTLFVPDNKVIVIGRRPNNEPVGEYVETRNANNPGLAAGAYTKVVDNGEDGVPRSIEVHRGHNGAPTIAFPSSVVIMSV